MKTQSSSRIIAVEKEFSSIYSSFLSLFYNHTIESRLGEDVFKFSNFLEECDLSGCISFDRTSIYFEEPKDLDLKKLVNCNIRFFKERKVNPRIIHCFLRVLNAVYDRLGSRFEEIIRMNMDFLLRFDLLYGISGGLFLDRIETDDSLADSDMIDSCLRIYRRIMYPILTPSIAENSSIRERMDDHYITASIMITDFGEILIEKSKEKIMGLREDRRLLITVERFNSLIRWLYEHILEREIMPIDELLRNLRLVLSLNKDKAIELGIYPSLLGSLATRIPQTQIHKVYSDYLEELVYERTKELKETEDTLLKSQRLAAIGEAAAMVGHDLRNPLQSIVNLLYIAEKSSKSSKDEDLIKILKTIRQQVEYMNKIVSDLQDYSKELHPQLVDTNLQHLINETILTIDFPEKIKVSVLMDKKTHIIAIDPTYLKRVVTNLIVNSIQAMGDGGRLIVSLTRSNNSVLIRVQDTGLGISKENLKKIFRPLFTTKSKGQGLGLAVCKRLIESLGGSIKVKSIEGKGSTFTIQLPCKILEDKSFEKPNLANK
jgi:signal transduction histidine kinase